MLVCDKAIKILRFFYMSHIYALNIFCLILKKYTVLQCFWSCNRAFDDFVNSFGNDLDEHRPYQVDFHYFVRVWTTKTFKLTKFQSIFFYFFLLFSFLFLFFVKRIDHKSWIRIQQVFILRFIEYKISIKNYIFVSKCTIFFFLSNNDV